MSEVLVRMWSDYLCPWCYLGRNRTALLIELGCTVEGAPIDDREVLDGLLHRAGTRREEVWAYVDSGASFADVQIARRDAHEAGVMGTPAWWFPGDLVLPGVQPRALFQRVVDRLSAR